MMESIGQYGPRYRGSSYYEARVPWLERAVKRTSTLRAKHEEAWKEYGCSIMLDGWTDIRQRHLINFLANSPAGTYFIGSIDASSEIANANMLADLLEKQIIKVGKEHVVQVITDNGANFKAAGRILMDKIPHLFWTPCAAHCLDLLFGGYWQDQGVQHLHQHGQEGFEVPVQAWATSQPNERKARWGPC